jgi:hypothetical protein
VSARRPCVSGGVGDRLTWQRWGARACGAQGLLNTDRGLGVGEQQRRTIEERARAVEAGNPTKVTTLTTLECDHEYLPSWWSLTEVNWFEEKLT